MSWLCSCGIINSGLNQLPCVMITSGNCSNRELHYPVSENTYDFHLELIDKRRIAALAKMLSVSSEGLKLMTEAEDLFAKFYNEEKILVADMDSLTFRTREEKLAKIAHEARARLTAISDVKREKIAKLKISQREWLVQNNDVDGELVSNAINAVEARKKRLNKGDKLKADLEKLLGKDNELVKKAMNNVMSKATESVMNNLTFSKKVDETKAEIKTVETSSEVETEPFDPNSLKF